MEKESNVKRASSTNKVSSRTGSPTFQEGSSENSSSRSLTTPAFFIIQEPASSIKQTLQSRENKSSSLSDHTTLDEETQDDIEMDQPQQSKSNQISNGFTILNRIGSSPEFPLYNKQSSNVYSSTKKRQLLSNGMGPHVASLQRTRLIPLPSIKKNNESEEITSSLLKERLLSMEKELIRMNKRTKENEKQIKHLQQEKQNLEHEKNHLTQQQQDIETLYRQSRNAFDKLNERYTSVYGNLQKLCGSDTSLHIVMQTLTRENQDLHRKVRILETQHGEDKILISNQEMKIKRLKGEMEALQHMKNQNDMVINVPHPSPISIPSEETPNRMAIEDCQYIDPNILKVLEKVDSQFSITNAIHLAVALKKWFHTCLHMMTSIDLTRVLHHHLQRVCELLHCQHAALFTIDHVHQQAIATVCERGRVNWVLPLDKGILGACVQQNLVYNIKKAYQDARFYSASDSVTNTKSREVLCIPITNELESVQSCNVFAVLQLWNTNHRKPFTSTDQIIGGLIAIQMGTIALQTTLHSTLQRMNTRVVQILTMHEQIIAKLPHPDPILSLVHLVETAQKRLMEILGVSQIRIYILDTDVMRIWHVGAQLDTSNSSLIPIRMYAKVTSSICALLLETKTRKCQILADPTSQPMYNDTVDLKGGANGVYLAPICSPWKEMPLGMIQVARTAKAFQTFTTQCHLETTSSSAIIKEKLQEQRAEDALTMELIELFCHQFSSLLDHAMAFHMNETRPVEVRDARLAYLSERLEALEVEYLREQEEAAIDTTHFTIQQEHSRPNSAIPDAQDLLSLTDTVYEIDLSTITNSLDTNSLSSRREE